MSDDLFDHFESERRKQEGIRRAATNRKALLKLARSIALEKAKANPFHECHSDQVQAELASLIDGYEPGWLGPASGSMFRGNKWEFTGRYVKSANVRNHARELKVWRLSDDEISERDGLPQPV